MTATQRVAALRQRRAEQGLVRLELYVHPDDHAAVKAVAQALAKQRSALQATEIERQRAVVRGNRAESALRASRGDV